MARKFRGLALARIRSLRRHLVSVQQGDVREGAKATKHMRLPVLFSTGPNLDAAIATLIARCDAALSQS